MTLDGSRRIVLIIEDSEICAVTLQVALESLPVELRFTSSVPAALKVLAAAADHVAAIITDLQLPGMSGLDLLERLRAEGRFRSIPVLIISGDSDPRVPSRALSSGAVAFFTKPYSPLEVRKKVEQLLR